MARHRSEAWCISLVVHLGHQTLINTGFFLKLASFFQFGGEGGNFPTNPPILYSSGFAAAQLFKGYHISVSLAKDSLADAITLWASAVVITRAPLRVSKLLRPPI